MFRSIKLNSPYNRFAPSPYGPCPYPGSEISISHCSVEASKHPPTYPNMTSKCTKCTKSVYAMEKLEVEGKPYHKLCLKCETCNKTLSLGNYAALEGRFYCKPHIKQLFALKGNYDEGFGRSQRKADWVKKDAPTNGAGGGVVTASEQTPAAEVADE